MAQWTSLRAAVTRLRHAPGLNGGLILVLILLLFAGAYALIYAAGGTHTAWPYAMLVPILLAAARFRIIGGIVGGIVGGLLLGPIMPLDATAGIPQDTANWLVRIAFYIGLGGFTGALFLFIRSQGRAREREARVDRDSGLPNKTALLESLQVGDTARAAAPFVVLGRIVNLGEVMEAAGVSAADRLVTTLAERIHQYTDRKPEVYRFSASELALLEHGVDRSDGLNARDLLRITRESVEVHGIPVHVELVAGSTGSVERDTLPREVIRRARVALFAAIERQQTLCHYSPEYERETRETIRLLAGVRRGINNGEFELHYQPKIRASTGQADGCEALVRWRDDDNGGLVPPGDFMPRVEQSALIAPLTRFVAESAFAFAQDSRQRISINFTARNLLDPDLIATIARMSAYGAIPPGSIEIEITEGAIVRDPIAAREAIGQLRQSGFHVSLDDFGTGYSSFEYLRMLPLTGLKIDRAFVRDLEEDPKACRLMACMIDVGHALGLEVVAEGVETAGQVALLEQFGCDLLQGFYFARPMPGREYLEWVHATTA